MNRTIEIIITIIGTVIGAFMVLVGGFILWMNNNQDFIIQIYNETTEMQELVPDVNEFIQGLKAVGMVFFMTSLIVVIVGIIAIVFLKGNKKPKPAGIMLIIIAILAPVFTQGMLLITGVFYLIAGIMALVRKQSPAPQQTLDVYE